MRRPFAYTLFAALPGAIACSAAEPASAPPLSDCVGLHCRPPFGAGATLPREASVAASRTGDANSESPPTTIMVDVTTTTDTAFSDVQPYRAPVVVRAESEDGQRWSTGDTPVRAPAAMQVAPGATWFAVLSSGPSRVIASTLQLAPVSAATPTVTLRAVSWDSLISLFIDNQPWAPQAGTGTVVLAFRRGGAPLRGVTVLPLPGTSVAYFESENRYTTEGFTAGFGSTVLVRDIARLPAYPSLASVTLQYQVGTATMLLPVRVAPDLVTFLSVDVP